METTDTKEASETHVRCVCLGGRVSAVSNNQIGPTSTGPFEHFVWSIAFGMRVVNRVGEAIAGIL